MFLMSFLVQLSILCILCLVIQLDKYVRPAKMGGIAGSCNATAVRGWLLSHFPCAGEAKNKALLMEKFSNSKWPSFL
jgi:hypothetical protein